ncbi:MAG TPA: pirin family protein [Candidatus Acidoferrales bacterium]|nr:pirin family protein [Candidatus Acidoferrales bacterium]
MITLRPRNERGHNNLGWLDTHFTFSFDQYFDPAHMGFRTLRVINEDVVAPGKGFGMHPHRDMEILTWVLEGALEHRDSTGSRGVLRPGELQHMTAGTGVMHSEMNPSPSQPVHLLQIWILPERKGLKPAYEQHTFAASDWNGGFVPLAGKDAPVSIHQDANLLAARMKPGEKISQAIEPGRHAWIQIARGSVRLNCNELTAGDGAAISNEKRLDFEAKEASEVLLFDLS